MSICKTEETDEFATVYLHNYGQTNPIPEGAIALCGQKSTSTGVGIQNPKREECCPICLALTEYE